MTGQCATAGPHRPQTDGESMPSRVSGFVGILLALLLVMSLPGCAKRPVEPAPPRTESLSAASLEWRIQTLEEKFLEFKEGRLARQSEMDRLRELLDSLDRRQARTEQDLRDIQDQVDAIEKDIMTRSSMAEARPVPQPLAEDGQAWKDVPSAPETKAEPEAKKPAPKPAPRKTPAKATSTPAAYKKALDMILGDKLAQGRKAMQAFLDADPKSPLAANAQYWIGESRYGEKDDAQAIVEFKKVYQAHPEHPKAAAALLKIGYAYERLGDTDNARFYLEALLEDFPDSEPARLARVKLGNLPQ